VHGRPTIEKALPGGLLCGVVTDGGEDGFGSIKSSSLGALRKKFNLAQTSNQTTCCSTHAHTYARKDLCRDFQVSAHARTTFIRGLPNNDTRTIENPFLPSVVCIIFPSFVQRYVRNNEDRNWQQSLHNRGGYRSLSMLSRCWT
jgi:hypothetical protein